MTRSFSDRIRFVECEQQNEDERLHEDYIAVNCCASVVVSGVYGSERRRPRNKFLLAHSIESSY